MLREGLVEAELLAHQDGRPLDGSSEISDELPKERVQAVWIHVHSSFPPGTVTLMGFGA